MADRDVLNRFIVSRPLAVMTRMALAELFHADELVELFDTHRQRGYQKTIQFEDLCTVVADVVLEFSPSPTKAYKDHRERLAVSKTAFFNKFNNIDPRLSAALVRHGCCARSAHREFAVSAKPHA